jgi:hypothetical protein
MIPCAELGGSSTAEGLYTRREKSEERSLHYGRDDIGERGERSLRYGRDDIGERGERSLHCGRDDIGESEERSLDYARDDIGESEERSLHCGRDDRSGKEKRGPSTTLGMTGALEVGEGGGFGGVVVEEAEEAGDFQGAAEVGAEIGEAEASALGYYFAVGFDQGAEAGAVHIVDVFEIDDDASGASGKKIVNGRAKAGAFFAERQTTAEGQKIEAIRFALRDFQSHRELSHAPI